MIDRWVCFRCGWVYEGPCRPHEPFGWTVAEVGRHMWEQHRDTSDSTQAGEWGHIPENVEEPT